MNKEEIITNLKKDNKIDGRNSMGVSESYYNKFYLTQSFLENKQINPENLSEKELNLIIELAEFAGDCFY
jgi:hypothetical protein